MPVATNPPTVTVITPPTGSVQTLLAAPGISGRFWVEVVNPNPTHKLYVSTASGTCTTSAKAADPAGGVWENPLGQSSALYGLWESGATAVPVQIIQYAA
jgi:hypothetical protein